MYMPGAPIGFLCLLGELVLTLEFLRSAGLLRAAGTGFLCALCMLTKQDFWLPALNLLAIACVVSWFVLRRRDLLFTLAGAFAVVLLAAISYIAAYSGWGTLLEILTGFGHVSEYGGRGLPSWERIMVQIAMMALLVAGVWLCFWISGTAPFGRFRRLLIPVFSVAAAGSALLLAKSYYASDLSRDLFPGLIQAAADTKRALQLQLFPTLLPFAVSLLLLVRWRRLRPKGLRNTALLLSGSPLQRGFDGYSNSSSGITSCLKFHSTF
jgi:hypothetical protein